MKRLLLALLLIPFFGLAQIVRVDSTSNNNFRKPKLPKYNSQTLYSYSIGIRAFSLEEFPKILNQVNSEDLTKSYVSGFIFKFNDNQISYRITGSFFNDNISFKNDCPECEEAKGKMTDNAFRIGFERNFNYSAIQPYMGFDLGYRRNSFKGSTENVGTAPYIASDIKSQKNGLSLSPLFGLKFNLINHLSIAAESSIDLLYSYEKQDRIYRDKNRTPNISKYQKWEFLLRPVSMLSLQYNFGVNY